MILILKKRSSVVNFKITEKEGFDYSVKSGDKNKIHTDDLYSYNSFFGEKICHGTLVLQKTLKLLKVKKNLKKLNHYFISINFSKHFSYNKTIKLISKKKLYQDDNIIAEINIKKKNYIENIEIKKKVYKINYKDHPNLDNFIVLNYLLDFLSKYVGMIYPEKNSIFFNIKINFKKKLKINKKKIFIYSKKVDKKFPIINNKLEHKNFSISFISSERPVFKPKKLQIKKNLINEIKKVNEPVLIIGASNGIGREMFNLFKHNKKINIFGTFNKNKFIIRKSNLKVFKLDLKKNISKLTKYFSSFNNLRIYFFATPKISLNENSKNKILEYRKFYIDYPKRILKIFKNKKIKFFYPSTIFIGKKQSHYTKLKSQAEKILYNCQNKNIKISILRINEIDTKQNLSLINKKLPTFSEMLGKNLNYRKKIFFK